MTLIKICGMTTAEDVDQAVAAGADMIGFILVPWSPRAIDLDLARNLATLTVEPILQRTLLSSVPKGFIAVAESGVTNRADLDAAGKAGASAALVGTAIMRNPELLVELTRP